MSHIKRYIDEIEGVIGYAIKEGYLDVEEARNMTMGEKEQYYKKSMAYDPPEEENE